MDKRFAHKLKENKSQQLPSNLILFDTETSQLKDKDNLISHKLRIGYACHLIVRRKNNKNTKTWLFFKTQDHFWSWVLKKHYNKTKLYILSHNITFDFTVVQGFKYLRSEGYNLYKFFSQGKTTIMQFSKDKHKIIVLDNLNFFPTSLKNLGKAVGLKKLDTDFNTNNEEELKLYCKRDVEILVKTWENYLNYIQKHELGNFSVTTPAQSFQAYRHRFMQTDIFIHNNKNALELERESYHGGRVECFFLGERKDKETYILDINSMYPYVMKTKKYPAKIIKYQYRPSVFDCYSFLENNLVIARVKLTINKNAFCTKKNNKLIFPIGSFSTVLTTPELKFAYRQAKKIEIIEMAVYNKKDLFDDYVSYFHNLKQIATANNEISERTFTKLMLNSLYGKFGQLATDWQKIGKCDNEMVRVEQVKDNSTKKWLSWYFFNGDIWQIKKDGESFNSFPAIASHVTAYARMYLYNLMQKAGIKNVYYCDTDSLFTNKAGFNNLKKHIKNSKLGKLELENISNNCIIYGCKDYKLNTKTKQKGVSKTAKKISETKYKQLNWLSFRGLLRLGDLNTYKTREVIKEFTREYNKGIIDKDGFITPFNLHE